MIYPHIWNVWRRHHQTQKLIPYDWHLPEFGYLAGNTWVFSHKLSGVHVRIAWTPEDWTPGDPPSVTYGGRRRDDGLPPELQAHLREVVRLRQLDALFRTQPAFLFGEGLGAGPDTGDGRKPETPSFHLFDIYTDRWLSVEEVWEIAQALRLLTPRVVGTGPLLEGIQLVRSAATEGQVGLVARPLIPLMADRGRRVIGKLKRRDFMEAPCP